MNEQERVAAFVAEHDLDAPPAYRLLDLVSEVGELAKAGATSTDYGTDPDELAIPEDEIGDVLFAVLALSTRLKIDADAALDQALAKYEDRLASSGSPGSSE